MSTSCRLLLLPVLYTSACCLALGCSDDTGTGSTPPLSGRADASRADATEASDVSPDGITEAGPEPDTGSMAQRMREIVTKLSVDLYPRDHTHPEHLDEAAAYISMHLETHVGPVSQQTYEVSGRTYRNVTASLGPDGGPRIVVGAHYDAVLNTPGADDNASGVAGLLQLAELMADDTLSTRVDFVGFTLEEPPHFATGDMGSARHAELLAKDGTDVKAMFSLEMIGYYDDEPGSQRYPFSGLESLYGNVGDFIAIIGKSEQEALVDQVYREMFKSMTLRVESLAAPPSLKGVDFSDHRSYWAKGWKAVMITDTAFYRNTEYHEPGDTMDRLDFEKMVDVVRGVRAAIIAVANN